MYIIWNYDIFPYMLCAKVKEQKEKGFYTVEGYTGMKFKALNVMTDKEGAAVKEMLENETQAFRNAEMKLKKEFNDKVAAQLLSICDYKSKK